MGYIQGSVWTFCMGWQVWFSTNQQLARHSQMNNVPHNVNAPHVTGRKDILFVSGGNIWPITVKYAKLATFPYVSLIFCDDNTGQKIYLYLVDTC